MQCVDEDFLLQSASDSEEAREEVGSALSRVMGFVLRGVRGVGGDMMKVRWNACHATGKVMQNRCLVSRHPEWQEGECIEADNLYLGTY